MHLTLAFLGEITEGERDAFCRIISGIEFRRFELRTTHIGAFPDLGKARVAYVGLESGEINRLHSTLYERIPENFRERREFVPHLTVSRFKLPTDIRGLFRENEKKDFGVYPVERLSLYKSELTPNGAIYTEMCGVQLM